MRLPSLRVALAVAGVAAALPAHAATCYQIWDRQDTLAYQSPLPPFALAGAEYDRSMERLRSQRSQLMFFDSMTCATVGSAAPIVRGRPEDPAALLVDKPMVSRRAGVAVGGGAAAPATSAPPAGAAPARR